MAMLEDWTIYSWYCPNCKTQVAGLKNKKNQIRVICTKCGVEMVRTVVSRRHDVIDLLIKQKQINGGETGEYRINHFSARCL